MTGEIITINIEHDKEKASSMDWSFIVQYLPLTSEGILSATRKTNYYNGDKAKISIAVELNDKSTLTKEEVWVLIQGLAGNTELTRIS